MVDDPAARRNVRLACKTCRTRKARCDGRQPVCTTCEIKGRVCDYTSAVDGRTFNRPHARIAELEAEIDSLRTRLAELSSPTSSTQPHSQLSAPHNYPPTEASPTHSDLSALNSNATLSAHRAADDLRLRPTGHTTYMGPTSVPPRQETRAREPNKPQGWLPVPPALHQNPINFNLSHHLNDQLLSLYFTHLNGMCAFVDEASFRDGLAVQGLLSLGAGPVPAHGYSQFLHLTILASAAHISSSPEVHPSHSSSAEAKGWVFLQQAITLLDGELEQPSPSTVLGLNLLLMCFADLGKSSLAWIYAGIAIRLAQDLGLHIDATPLVLRGSLAPDQVRLREDAYWTCYLQDKLVSLYVGRRPSLTRDDDNFLAPDPAAEQVGACAPGLGTVRSELVEIAHILAEITHLLYGIRRDHTISSDKVQQLNTKLEHWATTLDPSSPLPPASTPQVYVIHCLRNTAIILFNRPFLRRRSLDAVEGTRCLTAALSTINLAKAYDQQYGFAHATITMSQICHVSASVLLLLIADIYDQPERLSVQRQAEAGVAELLRLLTSLSTSWGVAAQSKAAIEAMQLEYTGKPAAADAVGAGAGAGGSAAPPLVATGVEGWPDEWASEDWWTLEGNHGWPTFEELFGLQGSMPM